MTKRNPGKKARYPKKLAAQLKKLEYYTNPQADCTTNYYYTSLLAKRAGLVITDGVNDMCEKLQCFWVVDHLASVMPKLRDTFYVVYVVKNPDDSFYFILDDGNNNIVHCKRHPYTNIKENLKLFLALDEQWVLYLPSEH